MTYHVSPLSYGERAQILQHLAEETDWNHAHADAIPWMKALPSDVFLAAKDDKGNVVGMILANDLDGRIGYIGEYIVRREHRGKGVGMTLWKAATDRLAMCNCVMLTARAQDSAWKIYRDKAGFNIIDWKVNKWFLTAPKLTHQDADESLYSLHSPPYNETLIKQVLEFDSIMMGGIKRVLWLQNWINHPEGRSGVITDHQGTVQGWGVIRKGTKGRLRLGPLYATSQGASQLALRHLLVGVGSKVVEFMTLSTNESMQQIAGSLDVAEVKRSYSYFLCKGEPPKDLLTGRVYCIADQEINVL